MYFHTAYIVCVNPSRSVQQAGPTCKPRQDSFNEDYVSTCREQGEETGHRVETRKGDVRKGREPWRELDRDARGDGRP